MDGVSKVNTPSTWRTTLVGCTVVLATFAGYGYAVWLSTENAFRGHVRFTNGWALGLSLMSIWSLYVVYGFLKRWVPSAALSSEKSYFEYPRKHHIIGLCLATVFTAICLPATFKSANHPREVLVFWVDEGDTLKLVHAIVTGENEIPSFRFSQGWVTILPVALPLKALNKLVPIEYIVTCVAMRAYLLLVLFGVVYFTYRLIWQITHSWWLAGAVVAIAYTRSEFFHIGLAIDRPDTFQLLFVLLSLLFTHRFIVMGQTKDFFWSVFFAAFAFASKYSGHLMTPVLLISFVIHLRRPEMRVAYPSTVGRWLLGAAIFAFAIVLIFPFTFFSLSPYHLCFLDDVIYFFQQSFEVYKTGNVYSLPNHEQPSHLGLWWGVFTSRYEFDLCLTILGLVGAGAAFVKNLVWRSREPRVVGEWILLAWGTCYISFLIYQYGLVDYRYIMPVQYVLPFFMLLPIYWLQQGTVFWRVPYRTVIGFTALALVFFATTQRMADTLRFLALYRSEESVQQCFAVGRFLDRTIPQGENPYILLTNVAYIPPRFKRMEIRNVDVTDERIAKYKFDYVIVTDNMLEIYADKPTKGHEDQFDPLFKVHYVDVVAAYTKFKHRNHPDYQYVRSFQDFHIFERIDRIKGREQVASAK